MSKLLAGFLNFCEAFGTAKAAAELTRLGYHREAQNLVRGSK